jgi:hypothetical protein
MKIAVDLVVQKSGIRVSKLLKNKGAATKSRSWYYNRPAFHCRRAFAPLHGRSVSNDGT